MSNALNQLLERAFKEASNFKDEYVSTEHLLLATTLQKKDAAAEILARHGATYDAILKALGDHPTRLTFDGRNLELMSPSPAHELYKVRLGRLLEALAFDLNIEILGGGEVPDGREEEDAGKQRSH